MEQLYKINNIQIIGILYLWDVIRILKGKILNVRILKSETIWNSQYQET